MTKTKVTSNRAWKFPFKVIASSSDKLIVDNDKWIFIFMVQWDRCFHPNGSCI